MQYEHSIDLSKVKEIMKKAGEAILSIYTENAADVEYKEDDSPLTRADKAAHQIIVKGLSQMAPTISIISEEHKNLPYEQRATKQYQWIVDPLDGTKEFINRNGEFTINIGLLNEQEVVFGMVYIPIQDKLYYATKGKGAFCESKNGKKQLHASTFSIQNEGIHIVCSRSHLNEATKRVVDQLKNPKLVSAGSSLKFLRIAEGAANLYPRIAPTMEWDTAAAQIILEESGGKVLQWKQNEAMRYNKENLLNPHFIAFGQTNDDISLLWKA